eukprot:7480382-Heterocapsa_arctica.AAC.1
MADDIEATAGYDKSARLDPDELQKRSEFRNAVAGRLLQFFGSVTPAAKDMYTLRGRLAAEVAREKKLAQAAALRGQEHCFSLPAIDPKHIGVPNARSQLIISVLDNPGVPIGAAPKAVTLTPPHLVRAQANAQAERSRSAHASRPGVPPLMRPPLAPHGRQGDLVAQALGAAPVT